MARKLYKLQAQDEVVNRIQDQLVQVLNPLLVQPVVRGSCGGNTALKSLIEALTKIGLISDQTTEA
jgi:hypothetical protein